MAGRQRAGRVQERESEETNDGKVGVSSESLKQLDEVKGVSEGNGRRSWMDQRRKNFFGKKFKLTSTIVCLNAPCEWTSLRYFEF